MTKEDVTQTTVNAGAMPDEKSEVEERTFDVTGNARVKGEDPSPDDRERGETGVKEASTS